MPRVKMDKSNKFKRKPSKKQLEKKAKESEFWREYEEGMARERAFWEEEKKRMTPKERASMEYFEELFDVAPGSQGDKVHGAQGHLDLQV